MSNTNTQPATEICEQPEVATSQHHNDATANGEDGQPESTTRTIEEECQPDPETNPEIEEGDQVLGTDDTHRVFRRCLFPPSSDESQPLSESSQQSQDTVPDNDGHMSEYPDPILDTPTATSKYY